VNNRGSSKNVKLLYLEFQYRYTHYYKRWTISHLKLVGLLLIRPK